MAPRILLLGDYSNCHRTLATGLRRLGCDVTVASDGSSYVACERDIDIHRRKGLIGGAIYWLDMHRRLRTQLTGFDIVAIHDVNFLSLRPSRLYGLFDVLKKNNGRVFLTAMSTDAAYIDMVTPPSPLRYSEWYVGKFLNPAADRAELDAWHARDLVDYQNYVFDNIDGAVSVLYEYHLAMLARLGEEKCAYGGIPVDLDDIPYIPLTTIPRRVRVFLGRDRNRIRLKGSDILEKAARNALWRHPGKASFNLIENVPLPVFMAAMADSHIVLDQIYSYTPATTALMALAQGKTVVSGAEPEYYSFIGENDNRPVVNAPLDVDGLAQLIEDLILHPETLAARGRDGRDFVAAHNDCTLVAKRFLDFWTR